MIQNPYRLVGRTKCLTLLFPIALLLSVGFAPSEADESVRIYTLFASEFVRLIPGNGKHAASFQMGSDKSPEEKPQHSVKLLTPFEIAKYEVTQELYAAVVGANPSRWKGPRNSVEMVNWAEANDFCRRATASMRQSKKIAADEVIRLPSEAEWEYACRAGSETEYSFGDGAEKLNAYAWFKDNSKGEDPPVGRKRPNEWGLYDMHGYVWEWCQDSWHATYDGAPNDSRAWQELDAKNRIVRGGSYADPADACRSAFRKSLPADTRLDSVGFRCAKSKETN